MAHQAGAPRTTKAVILVGGPSRGTRFRPLSLDVPKACNHSISSHPIIEHCFNAITKVADIKEVFIVGYYEESVFRDFIKDQGKDHPQITIRYLREYQALGTAGGLYHFRDQILKGRPDRFFVLNADVCCSFPLNEMLRVYEEKGAEAVILGTRVSKEAATNFGCIVTDPETKRVRHYVEKPESEISNLINCGVYLFSTDCIFPAVRSAIKRRAERPRLLTYPSMEDLQSLSMEDQDEDERDTAEVVRLEQDILADLADERQFYVLETGDFWRQIKTAGSAVPANALYLTKAFQYQSEELAKPSATILPPVFIHPSAQVDPTAKLGPNVSVGPRAVIGKGVRVKDSIILEDVHIRHDACVMHSIIGWGSRVGAWARVEGTPTPLTNHDTGIVKNGVKVQSISILGKECAVGEEAQLLSHGFKPLDIARLSEATSLPVVQPHYRLGPDHLYPTPIHDVAEAFEGAVNWLQKTFQKSQSHANGFKSPGLDDDQVKVAVVGDLVGGSSALALGMTECRVSGPARVTAISAREPILDWVFEHDVLLQRDATASSSGGDADSTSHASREAEVDAFHTLRHLSFPGRQPWRYFEPFASPLHFLRSPAGRVPETQPADARFDGIFRPQFEDIDEDVQDVEEAEDERITQSPSPSASDSLTEASLSLTPTIKRPMDPNDPRRFKRPLRYPPADHAASLVLPRMQISTHAQSLLRPQAEDFVRLLRRGQLRGQGFKMNRSIEKLMMNENLLAAEEAKQSEDMVDERVALARKGMEQFQLHSADENDDRREEQLINWLMMG
ncbi:MAG: hypothetical protein Q9159_006375 [Coniocarpon cinnabarinum]